MKRPLKNFHFFTNVGENIFNGKFSYAEPFGVHKTL